MSADLRGVLVVAVGALLLAAGVAMVYVPAGVITLGVVLLALGIFVDLAPKRGDGT